MSRLRRGVPIRLLRAAGRALGRLGVLRPAELRVEMAHAPRGRALVLLALAEAYRLEVPPADQYQLMTELHWRDFCRLALRSAAGPAPAVLSDAPGGRVRYDYYAPDRPGEVRAPYPLHPHFYRSRMDRRLPALRGGPRPIRLLFAGTLSPATYADSFRFPMPSRSAVAAHVLATFAADTLVVRSRADLPAAVAGEKPIVFVVTGDTSDTVRKHLLTPDEYTRLLARSAFALCPPGLVMPHAHNLTEALAVGTVPVLSYAPLCAPPLTPGADCVGFADLAELSAAVAWALGRSDAEREKLSRAAAVYYDTHCGVGGFADRLRRARAADPGHALILNDEAHSVALHPHETRT